MGEVLPNVLFALWKLTTSSKSLQYWSISFLMSYYMVFLMESLTMSQQENDVYAPGQPLEKNHYIFLQSKGGF